MIAQNFKKVQIKAIKLVEISHFRLKQNLNLDQKVKW